MDERRSGNGFDELAYLRQRNAHLDRVLRHTVEALELASSMGDFQTSLNQHDSPADILSKADERVRRIVPCAPVAFFLVREEDASFAPTYCSPEEERARMEDELDWLVESRALSFVLRRGRPSVFSCRDGSAQLLVHSVATASRIRGVFLGIPAQDPAEIPDSSLRLLSIVLLHCANALESYELYRLNREANQRLEERVRVRTRELEARTHELEEANRRLLALDELKSAFLSTVSHDLRTPLTSILGFVRLVLRDFERHYRPLGQGDASLESKGTRIATNLEITALESARLSRLINDLLDLARIESGEQEWNDTSLDLSELVRTAVQAHSGSLSDRPGVGLDLEAEADLPPVVADPDRISQVLANLLGNAIKFTKQGRISVRVGRADAGWLRVSVLDTGPGIPPEHLGRIFDKFHRVDGGDTLQGPVPGSGLGLAICKQIVERHGGRIWAESAPGQGAAFHFELPA